MIGKATSTWAYIILPCIHMLMYNVQCTNLLQSIYMYHAELPVYSDLVDGHLYNPSSSDWTELHVSVFSSFCSFWPYVHTFNSMTWQTYNSGASFTSFAVCSDFPSVDHGSGDKFDNFLLQAVHNSAIRYVISLCFMTVYEIESFKLTSQYVDRFMYTLCG